MAFCRMAEPFETAGLARGMFINGQWVDAIDGGTFAVANPATGDVIERA